MFFVVRFSIFVWRSVILVAILSSLWRMSTVTATIAAPAMQTMGVPPLAAHFFAFYFGTMSGVVPPVALTSFTFYRQFRRSMRELEGAEATGER